ncbi:MAG TPA: hypothetical protein VIP11_02565 [Gemmatimonadaceae bacterium]
MTDAKRRVKPGPFPGGRRFAFTVMDDTDVATVANVTPIYRLLESLDMATTKTVWPERCDVASSDFIDSETLEDPEYRDFVIDLQRRRFEIASHGASMESSSREKTIRGLERLAETFGEYPRVHANHSHNRDNLYWGRERLDNPILRLLYGAMLKQPRDFYQGHVPDSEYWWGDVSARHIEYVRNLTFADINLWRVNPSMPYRDTRRPYGKLWFSASDAENADEFVALLSEANQQQLELEGGVCIVATHFGKGFCVNGAVREDVHDVLTRLARRPGWFVPVGQLLDFLRERRNGDETIPGSEWRRMQWLWARDLFARRLRFLRRQS